MIDQIITYGTGDDSVGFPFASCDVEATALFAEDGIQQIGIRYTLSIKGMISAALTYNPTTGVITRAAAGATINRADFATWIARMRRFCSQRGKRLTVKWVDGATETVLYDFPVEMEENWGPHPEPLKITAFSGGLAARYEWSITVVTKECFTTTTCTPPSPVAPKILSITRRFDHAIDPNGLTTRTVSGKLVVSSEMIRRFSTTADAYRQDVVPPVPSYFKRESQSFSLSEDGRELTFTIVDVEQVWNLPDPITSGNASFSIRVDGTGTIATMTLSGYFDAPYSISKQTILQQVFALVDQRFSLSDANQSLFMESNEITEAVYGNRIDFNFVATTAAAGIGEGTVTIDNIESLFKSVNSKMGSPPPGNSGIFHPLTPYGGDAGGQSGVIASLPFFTHDACNRGTEDVRPSIPTNTVDTPPQGGGGSGVPGNDPPINGDQPNVSDAHKKAPFLAFHEEISYEIDNGWVIFTPKSTVHPPIAQQARQPVVHIIQAGYAIRLAKSPSDLGGTVPKPIMGTSGALFPASGKLLKASISPYTPEPIGSGSARRYTVHWRYLMQSTQNAMQGTMPEITYPADPRQATEKRPAVSGLDLLISSNAPPAPPRTGG